jgi:hypothetical protein
VAPRDRYRSAVLCVQDEHAAGMGIHFANATITGPDPDPMRATILLDEPVGNKLQLIGAERFIPLATGVKERPSLFGQPFDGPMGGTRPSNHPTCITMIFTYGCSNRTPLGCSSPSTPT